MIIEVAMYILTSNNLSLVYYPVVFYFVYGVCICEAFEIVT